MATVTAQTFVDPAGDGSTVIVQWQSLANGDSGSAIDEKWAQWADRSVQITGTFGAGGTILVEGSNDGTNYATLNNAQGSALSLTAAAIKQIAEMTRTTRPRVSAGDGTTALTVTLFMRRINPMRT